MRAAFALSVAFSFSVAAFADVPLFSPTDSCLSGSTAHVAVTKTGAAFVWTGLYPCPGLWAAVIEGNPPVQPNDQRIQFATGSTGGSAIASDGANAFAVGISKNCLVWSLIGPGVSLQGIIACDVGIAAPAVAWNGRNYVIAWSHVSNAVLTTRVDASGNWSGGINVLQPSQAEVPRVISIASGGEDSLVVWDRATYDVTCTCLPKVEVDSALVDADGRPRVSASILAPSASDPHVASNGSEYFVIWSGSPGYGIFGLRFALNGFPLESEPLPVAPPYDYQPRIAWNGSTYVVAWLHQVFAYSFPSYAPMDDSGHLGAPVTFGSRHDSTFDIGAGSDGRVVLVRDDLFPVAGPPDVILLEPRRRAVTP